MMRFLFGLWLIFFSTISLAGEAVILDFRTPPSTSSSNDIEGDFNGDMADYFSQLDHHRPSVKFSQLRAKLPQASSRCFYQFRPMKFLSPATNRRRAIYFDKMVAAACLNGLSPALVDALIIQESGYDPLALSPKGASGLMQLMPSTAIEIGVKDRWHPELNLSGGVRLLRDHLIRYNGRVDLALAAYNAGPNRVDRLGRVPHIIETQKYVRNILHLWTKLSN